MATLDAVALLAQLELPKAMMRVTGQDTDGERSRKHGLPVDEGEHLSPMSKRFAVDILSVGFAREVKPRPTSTELDSPFPGLCIKAPRPPLHSCCDQGLVHDGRVGSDASASLQRADSCFDTPSEQLEEPCTPRATSAVVSMFTPSKPATSFVSGQQGTPKAAVHAQQVDSPMWTPSAGELPFTPRRKSLAAPLFPAAGPSPPHRSAEWLAVRSTMQTKAATGAEEHLRDESPTRSTPSSINQFNSPEPNRRLQSYASWSPSLCSPQALKMSPTLGTPVSDAAARHRRCPSSGQQRDLGRCAAVGKFGRDTQLRFVLSTTLAAAQPKASLHAPNDVPVSPAVYRAHVAQAFQDWLSTQATVSSATRKSETKEP